MPFKQLVEISIKSLLTNRFRSFLTMLGVIIGVSSVILLVSIGSGFKTFIRGELEGLGSNLILVVPGEINVRGASPLRGGALGSFTSSKLKIADVDRLRENIPSIKAAVGVVFASSPVKFGDQEKTVQIAGTTPEFIKSRNAGLSRGEFFSESDVSGQRRVVVLGARVAEDLFGETSPVGERVLIGEGRFSVVGVLEKKGGFGQASIDDQVFAPITTVGQQFNLSNINFINIQVESAQAIGTTIPQVQQVLEERLESDEFTIITQEEILGTVSGILNTLTLALGGIAAISLLVGGIGIMNIMLVSVAERTREIGLRKAVGATPRLILAQFLVEAVILSLGGGVVGITLGVLGSLLVGQFITTTVTWWSIVLAFAVSVGVGIVFGIMPARKAANLTPVEALRYE